MWCVDMVRELISSDAAAREEKSITEVSRDIIPAIDFLDALKRKRKKGLLSIEFKVSAMFLFTFILTHFTIKVLCTSLIPLVNTVPFTGGSKKNKISSDGSRISRRRGSSDLVWGLPTPETVTFQTFCMSKRKNLDLWGGGAPAAPPGSVTAKN